MIAIKGMVRDGQIVLNEPVEWPNGTEVKVEPVSPEALPGLREEDWPTDREGIARHLALMDQIEPLLLSPEEEAEWKAALRARKEAEKATFAERAEQLRRMWE